MPLSFMHAKLKWRADRWRARAAFAFGALAMRSGLRSLMAKLWRRVAQRGSTLRAAWSAATRALALLPREWQFWTVAAISTVVMAVIQYNVPLWYGGSDHSDYYWYGRFLLGQVPPDVTIPPSWRTPGMGIFHIISGTVIFDSWKGFIALFAIFGAAIPVLFYLIVRPHSRNFALLAALAVILSMTPYIYATSAGSDQVFFFLHALLLLLCVSYFHRRLDRNLALPIGIAVVAAYAHMVRPVGAVLFWIFIALAVLLRPRDWRRLAAASAVYVAIMAVWVLWDRDYGTNGGAGPGLGYPLASGLATVAERRLAQAYFSPQGLVHAQSDEAAESYPSSSALRSVLRNFIAAHPEAWQRNTLFTPSSLFGRYAGERNGSGKPSRCALCGSQLPLFRFRRGGGQKRAGPGARARLAPRCSGRARNDRLERARPILSGQASAAPLWRRPEL